MFGTRVRLVALKVLSFALMLVSPAVAAAQTWDAFVAPAGHVAIKDTLDGPSFDPLRQCLPSLGSPLGAQYYATVVEVSDREGRKGAAYSDAVEYVDAYFHFLRDQPGATIDPDDHILMAMSTDNHGIAIHPGHKWVQLGFERDVVKSTIDGSKFGEFARGGDFGGALCELAKAVDAKLIELNKVATRRLQQLREGLTPLRTKLNSAKADVETRARDKTIDKDFEQLLLRTLERATISLDRVEYALRRGDMPGASEASTAASEGLLMVSSRLRRLDAVEAEVRTEHQLMEEYRADIGRRADKDWELPRRALVRIQACQGEARDVSVAVRHGKSANVATCRFEIIGLIERADTRYYVVTEVVPGVGLVLLIVLLFALGLARSSRRRAELAVTLEVLEGWDQKLQNASVRLVDLENTYPLYFGAATERWSGESREIDQRCADAVNQVFLLYGRAQELLSEAHQLVDGCGLLAVGPLLEARELLTSHQIVIKTGDAKSDRRIFAPLTRAYRGDAATLLSDLNRVYGEAIEALNEVRDTFVRVQSLEDDVNEVAVRAIDAISARHGLGYPVDHLQQILDDAVETQQTGLRYAKTDPILSTRRLEEALAHLRSIAERAESGNDTILAVRGVVADTGRALRARVAELRDEGFSLDEPGFNPDARLDKSVRSAQFAVGQVAGGDEEAAVETLARLRSDLELLGQQLEAIHDARGRVPKEVTRQREQRERLVERIPRALETLAALGAEHADDTFTSEADNLSELAEVLERLVGWEEHLINDHANQRYLAALADIETAEDLLVAGAALLDGIQTIESRLDQARTDAREVRAECDDLVRNAEELLDKHAREIGRDLAKTSAAAIAAAREVFEGTTEPKPNWLALRDQLQDSRISLSHAVETMRADIAQMAAVEVLARQLTSRVELLSDKIESEERDRPPVAEAAEIARGKLLDWKKDVAVASFGGARLHELSGEVEASIVHAEQVWEEEMSIIEQAEATLRRAEANIALSPYFGEGVTATYWRATGPLAAARAALLDGYWEQGALKAQEALSLIAEDNASCRRKASARRAARAARARAAARRSSWSSSSGAGASSSSASTSSFGSSWTSTSSLSSSSSSSWSSASTSSSSSWSGSSTSGGSTW